MTQRTKLLKLERKEGGGGRYINSLHSKFFPKNPTKGLHKKNTKSDKRFAHKKAGNPTKRFTSKKQEIPLKGLHKKAEILLKVYTKKQEIRQKVYTKKSGNPTNGNKKTGNPTKVYTKNTGNPTKGLHKTACEIWTFRVQIKRKWFYLRNYTKIQTALKNTGLTLQRRSALTFNYISLKQFTFLWP